MVFSLANRASEIFESSEPEEKRQLLSFLLQNCLLNGRKLEYTLKSPFNTILEVAHDPDWYRQRDSPIGPGALRTLAPFESCVLTSRSASELALGILKLLWWYRQRDSNPCCHIESVES